ncbi:hypothetical protein GW17_00046264, partial [Ensete ventricosum]
VQPPEILGSGGIPAAHQRFSRWEYRKSDSLHFSNPDMNHMLTNSLITIKHDHQAYASLPQSGNLRYSLRRVSRSSSGDLPECS